MTAPGPYYVQVPRSAVEDQLVDVLAVYDLGRFLAAEGASSEEWAAYRVWRDRVMERAEAVASVSA